MTYEWTTFRKLTVVVKELRSVEPGPARHPDNVAPWVVWLCTEAAAHISGQNFVVGGGMVQLVSGWSIESAIDKAERWTLDELDDRWRDLFGDRPTGPPQRMAPPRPPANSA